MPSVPPDLFLKLLSDRGSFLLTGHEHPDGDCVGAQVALFHLLRALGKEVAVVNPDPPAPQLDFLLEHTPIGAYRRGGDLPPFEVAVLLDCAELSRLAHLGVELRSRGAEIAVVDHHVGSESGDGSVAFVDSRAAATGAMIFDLYRALDVPLSPAAAEGVFLSLVSDTGWFRYSNTDSAVLSMAAELVGAGVDPCRIYDLLFRRNQRESVDLLAAGLSRHGFLLDGRFAYVCFDKAMMDRIAKAGFDTDPVLDPLRSVEGVEVVGLFKERFDGAIKLSLRAKGDVDVRAIAAHFGGGGHHKAAGAVIEAPMTEALHAVEERLRLVLAAE